MADQRCGRCKVVKDQNEFSPSYRGRNGTWCRACFAEYSRKAGPPPAAVHAPVACAHCGNLYTPKALKANAQFCSRACGEASRRDSGKTREKHLVRTYGITRADYDCMLAAQGGTCALCDATPETQRAKYTTYFHVDHCHTTGRVRGLLCGEHNLMLGRFGDDPAQLRAAADYLERPPM